MDHHLLYIGIAVAVIVLLIAVYCFLRFGHIKRKPKLKSGLDLDKLVAGLGGRDNISHLEADGSKVVFQLADARQIRAEEIKALGASGIVSSKDKVSITFGKVSEPLAVELTDYLKNR